MRKILSIFLFGLFVNFNISAQIHEGTVELGGVFNDEGTASAADAQSNLYLVGNYVDSIDLDPSSNNAIHTTTNAPNSFIVKYDSSGNYNWSKSINGQQLINIRDIELSSSENAIYVVGDFMDTARFKPNSAPINTPVSNGVFDVFIAKYDTSGVLLWARSFGGPAPDWGYDISVDRSDNLYVTGSFLVFTDFDPSTSGNATINTFGGSPDIFIAKYDASGNYLWAKNAGSNGLDEGLAITTDDSGNSYLTGRSGGPTSAFDTLNIGNRGADDIFIAKYNAQGNALWAKNYGGPAPDQGTDVKLVGSKLFLSANYQAIAFMDTSSSAAPAHSSVGDKDVLFAEFDTSGAYIWSKSIGGSLEDLSTSLDIDTAGSIYISGAFEDTMNFAVGIGDYRIPSLGGQDAFMAKYDKNANFIWAHGFGEVDDDEALNLDLSNDHIYLTGSFQNTVDFDPDTSLNSANVASPNGSVFLSKYSNCYGNHSFDTLSVCPNTSADYGSYYNFTEAGDHHLRLVDPAGCDTLVTLHVTMNDTVDVRLNPGSATIFALNTSASIQWIDCIADTIIPGADSTAFTPLMNGNYAAVITDSVTSCVDTSACIPWFPIGLKESNSKSAFTIYPNPAKDHLSIKSAKSTNIELFNQSGKLVLESRIQEGSNKLKLEGLRPGIYFLRFTNTNKYRKIILH